ncbi:Glycoside hydrolase family 2 immunoglobulin-like beta-sandwich [Penicillium tannophilum]|nr:Glycoside hydrolase family 2 immunoglobulin-like beta-sandwich [Penicillium tannophilum]
MNLFKRLAAWSAALCVTTAHAEPLVSSPGERAVIRGWSMQSATRAQIGMSRLSQPGVNVSSWYRVGGRSTVMAGLLENGVYNETELFFSNNMENLADQAIFKEPWIYREEFSIFPANNQHVTLKTHGITSKAEIYVNGALIATSDQQQGSYGGHQYDLTNHLRSGFNCLLIVAYPTNYLRDFAMGFLDWNPYPADNGTGIWRDVEIIQTGAVSMSPLRVVTDFSKAESNDNVNVTLKTEISNHAPHTVQVEVNGTIIGPIYADNAAIWGTFDLQPGEEKTVSVEAALRNPQIWWPSGWGEQPMYTIEVDAMIKEDELILSDSSVQTFGIRYVSSHLNEHNDTTFAVNGHPFQVLGAGYSADIFMRFDKQRISTIFQYMIDLGLNTIRLEGKQEHPEFYDLADQMGLMVLAGWECCNKWEAWDYNKDADGVKWEESDYGVARASMLHEAEMMQAHPSLLGFLVGSDYWPNDHAAELYIEALNQMDWNLPIIASASKRGYPEALGPSGMKMSGPYDWVPPNYWYGDEEGAAFGFGSELGTGVGTPEYDSLQKFMSNKDLDTLWKEPHMGSYHMSTNVSAFYGRSIYNRGLFARYGMPSSIEDYVTKCQMADYEATRAQFEAYSARQNASRPATGAIYWMLNSAWPNLHWQLFDYYLQSMGSYFGTKVGTRVEHVAYNYEDETFWLINHSLDKQGEREISVDLIDTKGKKISSAKVKTDTTPSSSKEVKMVKGIDKIKDVGFLRLVLRDVKGKRNLSRNVYWLSPKPDVLDWPESTWISTPVTEYADFTRLGSLPPANVKVTMKSPEKAQSGNGWTSLEVRLENQSKVPALFIHLDMFNPVDDTKLKSVYWSDNYVTLWPKETLHLTVSYEGEIANISNWLKVTGRNIRYNGLANI